MPINVTPGSGRAITSTMFDRTPAGSSTSGWLPVSHFAAVRARRVPDHLHRIPVAQNVLHHDETNESWGSDG
jgi:hypothetical protein